MPVLDNPRHERFVQLIVVADAKSVRRGLAYIAAGYTAKLDTTLPGLAWPADVGACKLLKKPKVKARLLEITTMAAKRHEITQDTLLDELEQARQSALANSQASAAVAASMGKAKLCGMIVERKETGKPGDFDNMTVEELRMFIQASIDTKTPTNDGSDAVN